MSNNETESDPQTDRGRDILNSIPIGILETDPAGKILYSNPAFHDMTGEDRNLIGSSILDLFDADDERKSVSEFLVILTKDEPSPIPVHFVTKRTKSGRLIDLLFMIVGIALFCK